MQELFYPAVPYKSVHNLTIINWYFQLHCLLIPRLKTSLGNSYPHELIQILQKSLRIKSISMILLSCIPHIMWLLIHPLSQWVVLVEEQKKPINATNV